MALTAQNAKLAGYRTALAAAQTALPLAADRNATPNLLRSLAGLAAGTATNLGSVTVGSPTAVIAAPAAAAPTDTSSGSSSSVTATPATPAAPPAPTSSISTIDVQTTVSGTVPHLSAFLSQLQSHTGRAVLVTSVTLAQRADVGAGGGTTLTLDMTAFVRDS